MDDVALATLAAVIGYVLGSIPSADLVSRIATRGRVDLHEAGSGNPGALNAMKVLGTGWGLTVLAADVAKGAAAGAAGLLVGADAGAYAAATAAVAGHIFPLWNRFHGGKGVATSAGACLAVFPAYFLIDLAVAGAGALKSRRAEVGTQIACAIWIVSAALWWMTGLPNLWGPEPSAGLLAFAIIASSMILWRFHLGARRTAVV